jgi:hypothetical protein
VIIVGCSFLLLFVSDMEVAQGSAIEKMLPGRVQKLVDTLQLVLPYASGAIPVLVMLQSWSTIFFHFSATFATILLFILLGGMIAGTAGITRMFYLGKAIKLRKILLWLPKHLMGKAMQGSQVKAFGDLPHFIQTVFYVFCCTQLIGIIFFTFDWFALPRFLGAINVLNLACAGWIVISTGLHLVQIRKGVPIVPILFISLLFLSPLRNNHEIRTIPQPPGSESTVVTACVSLTDAYNNWNRPDSLKGKPIFILSIEGGGMRSAYWSGLLLSAIQDRFPDFNRRIFATSSVSGGSIGVGVFSALSQTAGAPGKTFRDRADSVLCRDFLSPVIARTLFPEVLQRFLPCNIPFFSARFDRARALETGWEQSWRRESGGSDNLLADGFLSARARGCERGIIPAMFLNCTWVETGLRGVVSNVKLPKSSLAFDLLDTVGVDIPFSTAMHLSARFPFVSPGGSVKKANSGLWGHIVDGGYFDNSGAMTAAEIGAELQTLFASPTGSPKPEIYFLVITNQPMPSSVTPMTWYNDFREPIATFGNVWSQRSGGAVAELKRQFNLGDSGAVNHVIELNFDAKPSLVPVGWYLSESARDTVKARIALTLEGKGSAGEGFKKLKALLAGI